MAAAWHNRRLDPALSLDSHGCCSVGPGPVSVEIAARPCSIAIGLKAVVVVVAVVSQVPDLAQ
jgi:hypothetical protein